MIGMRSLRLDLTRTSLQHPDKDNTQTRRIAQNLECQVLQNVRKQRKPLSVTSAYSKATYSRIEEDTEGSTEEDDWLLSDEEDEDEYRRGLSGPPSYVLERLPTSDNSMERTAEEKKQDEESRACAIAMAKIAWDTKAEDVTVLHVAPVVYWCSYMVFATIKSRPQMQAVVAKIEQKAEQEWNRPISQLAKTSRGGEWEAMDLMDVVVHVFTAEQRDKYNLDAYYSQAEEIELPFLSETEQSLGWTKTLPQ